MGRKIVVGDCCVMGSETFICEATFKGNPKNAETPNWDTVLTYCIESEISATMTAHAFRQYPLPTLHLPIGNDQKRHGGKWFDMILSGEKTEEYGEIAGQKQTYHNVGVLTTCRMGLAQYEGKTFGDIYLSKLLKSNFEFKPLKVVHLTNGYGHSRPQLWAHIEEITIGRGNPEWGAPEHDVFIIKLGEVFHTKNLKETCK